jgi:hypothetical protein
MSLLFKPEFRQNAAGMRVHPENMVVFELDHQTFGKPELGDPGDACMLGELGAELDAEVGQAEAEQLVGLVR